MSDIKPGDVLFFSSDHRRSEALQPRTVESVGRKWINFGRGLERCNRNDLRADGGDYSSPGRYWRSVADFEAARDRGKAWKELHECIRWMTAPDYLSAADIRTLIRTIKGNGA
jgi:hypothetical protein